MTGLMGGETENQISCQSGQGLNRRAWIWEAQRVAALGLEGLMQQAGSVRVKMEIF